MSKGLDNGTGYYDNILLLVYFNLGFSELSLNNVCDIYKWKNVVQKPPCF